MGHKLNKQTSVSTALSHLSEELDFYCSEFLATCEYSAVFLPVYTHKVILIRVRIA